VNLAVNARDAMPDGGKITFETANVTVGTGGVSELPIIPAGRYVMLAIGDTGHGMDEPTRARIFEPFFSTKEAGKGTGLGLSTVYGIVKQSEGFISVRSEPGQGATFKVYLPYVDDAAETPAVMAPKSENTRGTETVLLVEDEDAVRSLAEAALTQSGYRVLAAANGGDALLRCERYAYPIHLIITDVAMPGMGGPELVRRLAPLRPDMKVLFMSGYFDQTGHSPTVMKPGSALLEKPFTPLKLLRRVREALDDC
jgi:CheY-like chemotaxis protein